MIPRASKLNNAETKSPTKAGSLESVLLDETCQQESHWRCLCYKMGFIVENRISHTDITAVTQDGRTVQICVVL